jgi:signal transduction histidine kinase
MRAEQQTKLSDLFREIHLSGQRMLALVNNLLDIAKIESAEQSYDIQPVNVTLIVRKVCDELFPLIQGRGLRIHDLFSHHTIMAQADPLRLQQVLINVMANAIKFSPEGGVITLAVEPYLAGVRLSVADQGCGIPPSELEQIFEPFVQSSETKDGSGGTGLGLAICKKIIQGMGGEIHAGNQPSGGAVFHIDLPSAGSLKN